MNAEQLIGRNLALLLIGKKSSGEDEWMVVFGTVQEHDGQFVLNRGADRQPFSLMPEWFSRVRPVSADQAEIFDNAEYFIPLTVGPLPEGATPEEFLFTGLRIPSE